MGLPLRKRTLRTGAGAAAMKLSVIVPVLNQHRLATVALDHCCRNAILSDTEFVLLDNGSDTSFGPTTPGLMIERKPEPIGVYPTFWWGKDVASGEILAYIHSDLMVAEPGWDQRVLQAFEAEPGLGLIGFVGSNEIDQAGGRGLGTASNFLGGSYIDGVSTWIGTPAEAHGRRLTGSMRAAVVDGCAMIFRREALDRIPSRPNFPPHHFYDRLLSCEILERGYQVWVLGIGCDHISNQTVGTQNKYHRLAEQWCRLHGIAASAGDNWDLAVYNEAERQFLSEYCELKRLIPMRIADDGRAPRSQSVAATVKVAIVMPVVNLWWQYTKPALDTIATATEQAARHGICCRTLLIDNASTDDTIREAGRLVSEAFSHKRNEERWNFSRSVNYGVADAWEHGFDYSFVVNNDILLHPEAIWRLVQRIRQGDLGIATCHDARGETTPDRFLSMDAEAKAVVAETPHPNFSAFMISRDCWTQTGEFDEGFRPAYWEDNDYHYRMKLAGQMAVTFPSALFYHFGSRTQTEAAENGQPITSAWQFERLRTRYVAKWGGPPGEEIYRAPFNLTDTTRGQSIITGASELTFDSGDLEALLWQSSRPVQSSAWHGHVAFAHWVVHVARPGLIVELGTQNAVSYAAFCHASALCGVCARCFAIDTWKGDCHTGWYSEETFTEVSAFNEANFKGFSTLLRTAFDEALSGFEDGTIDLLHIDGFHTYEAVRHDFEAWYPKLSRRGIVLFHDTAVRDFGVWKLWDEVSDRFPSFEFDHSAGLGVLLVGADQPAKLRALCATSTSTEIARLRANFSLLSEWAKRC